MIALMSKRFRVCSLDQEFLLPPSLQDWLPEDHLARFIADVVNELDLSAIYAEYERKDGRGLSAYHPLLMTRLLLYGYCIGITSSRKFDFSQSSPQNGTVILLDDTTGEVTSGVSSALDATDRLSGKVARPGSVLEMQKNQRLLGFLLSAKPRPYKSSALRSGVSGRSCGRSG